MTIAVNVMRRSNDIRRDKFHDARESQNSSAFLATQ
jgi:hypothetical protein